MTFAYPAILHKTPQNTYTAVFPDLADCQAEGDTLNECLDNAYDAMYNWLYIELTLEEGEFVRNISAIMRLTDGWDE